MSEYKIEKGIPAPKGKRASRWPFTTMEVGDSVLFPADVAKLAGDAARQQNSKTNKEFRLRREGEGVRIWRVA